MLKQVGITKQGLLGTQDDDRIVTFTLLLPPVAGALTDVGVIV